MKTNKGFSLFELLVSISIIGILVALASVSYSAVQRKARDSRMIQDMNQIQKAAEQYYNGNNYNYPVASMYYAGQKWAGYLELFPADPKGNAYLGSGDANQYCLCAQLDNVTGGNSADSNCNFTTGGPFYCVKNQQ